MPQLETSKNSNNVLPFEQWKISSQVRHQNDAVERPYQEYFQVLSFHDLVNEYQAVINELNSSPLDKDLTAKSRQILRELNERIGEHSPEQYESILTLRKKIEKRIFDLNGLL